MAQLMTIAIIAINSARHQKSRAIA